MKAYYKKEYIFLYLSKFCYSVANSFIDIFGVVTLYTNGMELYKILLIYGIRFGIMGLLSPLFIAISSKFGIFICSFLANLLRIVSSYMILNGNYDNILFFIFSMALPGALSNPIVDAISNKYVNSRYRGRYNSIINISKILGSAISSMLIGYGLISNNTNLLFAIISVFFVLDSIFTKFVDYKPQKTKNNCFKETMNYILKSKSNYKIIYCARTSHIIERLFIPLYIFLILKDYKSFTIVITLSLIIQILTVIIVGKLLDKNLIKSTKIVSVVKVLITSLYIFPHNKYLISITKIINDNFEKIYETSIQTSIQNIIKNSSEDYNLLSTVGQMSLCFTEIIVFSLLSLISISIKEKVFIIIFILSILSTIIINIKIQNDLNVNCEE